jgi:hypothetical protein
MMREFDACHAVENEFQSEILPELQQQEGRN